MAVIEDGKIKIKPLELDAGKLKLKPEDEKGRRKRRQC